MLLNQRKDLWISEFERSCEQAKTKLFQSSVFSLSPHVQGFANIGEIFYKVHSLTPKQVFNWIEQKTCSVNWFYYCRGGRGGFLAQI